MMICSWVKIIPLLYNVFRCPSCKLRFTGFTLLLQEVSNLWERTRFAILVFSAATNTSVMCFTLSFQARFASVFACCSIFWFLRLSLFHLASIWQWIELQVFSCHHLWFGALKLPETRLNWVFLRQLWIHQLYYLSRLINLSAWFWHEGLEGRIWEMWNDSALVVVRKELFGGSRMAFAKS